MNKSRPFLILITNFLLIPSTHCYDKKYLDMALTKHFNSYGAKSEAPAQVKPPFDFDKPLEVIKTLFKPVYFEIKELSDRDKRELVFCASPSNPVEGHKIIDMSFVDKIELVSGAGKNMTDHLITRLTTFTNDTQEPIELIQTHAGKKRIFEVITQPISDIQTLQNRQALLRELLENENLFMHVRKFFMMQKK